MGIGKLLGLKFPFGDECEAAVTEESDDSIFIESAFFTGWMFKTEFWDLWGLQDA